MAVEDFVSDRCAVVHFVSQFMGGAEWYIFEPDSSSFFITGEEWVFCNELAARSVTFLF